MPANPKLQRFPRSKIWDPKTQKIMDSLRAYIHREPQPTISKIQHDSLKAKRLSDTFNCFQDVLPISSDDVKDLLVETIDGVKKIEYQRPFLAPVTVEWVGQKAPSTSRADATCPTSEQWASLVRGMRSNLTILHVHGGAFLYVENFVLLDVINAMSSQGSPEAYRSTTSQLAALSGGRVASVKYRLAPQYPFPTGLLDVLVAYLSLLFPHPRSPHQAINPSTMVFAGDSSGANMLYALLQIIRLTQQHAPITFHSHKIKFPLPFPAGLATLGFNGDPLNSLPSYTLNRVNDLYLEIPWSLPSYPKCELWPTNPPRSQVHATTSAHAHPLLTPALAHDCSGMPPMWFAVGDEQIVDGSWAVARRAALQGVQVDWVRFQAMPHCFATLPGLDTAWQAKACMQKWAAFCRACVEPQDRGRPRVKAIRVDFSSGREMEVELEDESALPLDEVERRVLTMIDQVEDAFRAAWEGKFVSKL
ncbi:MAG: hypothetical protein LQ341_005071 [Variospora aurantia]|nr:MAG: hypothetical protein LQ341_005071 [Variospora aurantia]